MVSTGQEAASNITIQTFSISVFMFSQSTMPGTPDTVLGDYAIGFFGLLVYTIILELIQAFSGSKGILPIRFFAMHCVLNKGNRENIIRVENNLVILRSIPATVEASRRLCHMRCP